MDLREYVAAVAKRWYIVTTLVVLGVVVGVYKAQTTPPTYQANSQVFVSLRGVSSVQDMVQGSTYTQNLVQSYAELARMPAVLDPVIRKLGLRTTSRSLARSVATQNPLNTVIIQITATSREATQAADISNAVADQLKTTVADLSPKSAKPSKDDMVQVSVVARASAPSAPISPNKRLMVLLGLMGGAFVGILLAWLRHLLDNRLRTTEEIAEITDLPLLGSIPQLRSRQGRAVTAIAPNAVASEAYRRLQTNLQFLDSSEPLDAVVVTSSLGREGKSLTALNLALAIAEKGQRVLLAEADMRKPSIGSYCNLEESVGLTTVLIGKSQLREVVQAWGPANLDVLTLGETPPNPSQLLGSPAMVELLDRAREEYDLVILDAPPLLPVSDAAILAHLTSGAIVVAGCHSVRRREFSDALATLDAVDARCLGIVANRVRNSTQGSYYGRPTGPLARLRNLGAPTELERPPRVHRRSSRMASTTALSPAANTGPASTLSGSKR